MLRLVVEDETGGGQRMIDMADDDFLNGIWQGVACTFDR